MDEIAIVVNSVSLTFFNILQLQVKKQSLIGTDKEKIKSTQVNYYFIRYIIVMRCLTASISYL